MIPEFRLTIPVIGNTWAVGLSFQIHLVFVAFIMGIAIIAPIAEFAGLRRGNEHWERLAHELASTITRFFSFAATWAVLAIVLLYGLYPRLFGVLTSIFFGQLLVVAVIWFVMTVTAYLYYHTWDRLGKRRGWHIAIGALFAGSTFTFITLITMLSSYQLTPTDPTSSTAAAFNPSWSTEIIHRHIGNLSYAGLILASYAAIRAAFSRVDIDKAYYDWLGHFGLLLGAGLMLLQPIGGWFYARQIMIASPQAYVRMMVGENSWLFLVQTFFLDVVFLLGNIYLALAIERGRPSTGTISWMRRSIWILSILALLAIVPKEWPLGQMMPWKYIALVGLVLLTLVNLWLYLRTRRSFVWGKASPRSYTSLAILGVAIVALIVTMGVIRESAKGSDLIYHRLGGDQGQEIQGP